jgi:hypothetical protein
MIVNYKKSGTSQIGLNFTNILQTAFAFSYVKLY